MVTPFDAQDEVNYQQAKRLGNILLDSGGVVEWESQTSLANLLVFVEPDAKSANLCRQHQRTKE